MTNRMTIDLHRVTGGARIPTYITDSVIDAYDSDVNIMEGTIGDMFIDMDDYSRTAHYQHQVTIACIVIRNVMKCVANNQHTEFNAVLLQLVHRSGTLYTIYF